MARYEEVTSTAAFRDWFGDSKVVDAKGQPLVVYHGTATGPLTGPHFTTFEPEHVVDRGGLLAFFSSSPKFAQGYARASLNRSAAWRVYPVFLRIENPFDYRQDPDVAYRFYEDTGGIEDDFAAWHVLGAPEEGEDGAAMELTADRFADAIRQGEYPAIEAPEFVSYLRNALGYDGIVTLEVGATNFAVFEPGQIKSATGNVGTFDKSKPDIRHNPKRGRARRR